MLNMSSKDLRSLTVPLIIFAAVCAGGAIAVFGSGKLVIKTREGLAQQESAYAQAVNRIQQSDSEKQVIERYVGPYSQLERAGIVGEEQRISWIDALRTANSETDLYGVNYEVGAQQPYSFAAEATAGNLSVRQSVMKLRFDLLHEEDLLRFFQALAALRVGQFAVNECNLQRTRVDLSVPVNQPTLVAECEVAWITIGGPGAEERKS
jgi:hypothetical protein